MEESRSVVEEEKQPETTDESIAPEQDRERNVRAQKLNLGTKKPRARKASSLARLDSVRKDWNTWTLAVLGTKEPRCDIQTSHGGTVSSHEHFGGSAGFAIHNDRERFEVFSPSTVRNRSF